MKKYLSIILSLCLLLSSAVVFTSCKSNNDNAESGAQNSDVYTDNKDQGYVDANSITNVCFPFSTAIVDKNGDTYFITLDKLNKISAETGEITIIDGVFENQYGHSLALHNDYIYYAFGTSLYRINKNGTEKYQFDDGNIYGDFVAVVDDNLYVSIYNEEMNSMEYFIADISGEPDNLSLTFINYDNNLYFCADEAKSKLLEYSKAIMPDYDLSIDAMDGNTEPQYPIAYFAASGKYLYYINLDVIDLEKAVGRIDMVTMEIETVPIFSKGMISPAVTEGWIYYTDNNGDTYRISEDFGETEKL